MLDSRPLLLATDFPMINRGQLDTLQVNLGYLCNLSCVHCHVNAGPTRTELMDLETIELILAYIDGHDIKTRIFSRVLAKFCVSRCAAA